MDIRKIHLTKHRRPRKVKMPSGYHGKRCPDCKSTALIKRGKYTDALGVKHQKYTCKRCGLVTYLPEDIDDKPNKSILE